MKNYAIFIKLLLILIFPLGLLAQNTSPKTEITFDQEHFKESNYDILEMFSSVLYDSTEYVTFITVSKDYEMSGIGERARQDSLKVNILIEQKDAKSAEIQENLTLKPGDELFNYLAEHLNPETIISFRKVAIDEVQVKRYALLFD